MRLIFCLCLVALCNQLPAQQKFDYYSSGLPQYRYELKNGALEGEFVSYYDNGVIRAKGVFANSQKTGVWLAWDTSGVLRTKRLYRDNNDFDVLSEWTTEGCIIDSASLKSADAKPIKLHDGVIYVQRYWKMIAPDTTNNELFNGRFKALLDSEIIAGKTILFEDDRFVRPIDISRAAAITGKERLGFVAKQERTFDGDNQQWFTRIIGLGLMYKEDTVSKTAWIYFNDFYQSLIKTTDPALVTAGKIMDDRFDGRIIMTTQKSPGFKPRPVDEKDIVGLALDTIDFETGAWIYLLNQKLQAQR